MEGVSNSPADLILDGVYTSLRKTVGIIFSRKKSNILLQDESFSVLSCSLCTEGNIGKKLRNRDGLDYSDKEHKIVLRNGNFKVQCKNGKHKFHFNKKLVKNLDLKCDEDNSQSHTITIDFKHSEMPECLGRSKTHIKR